MFQVQVSGIEAVRFVSPAQFIGAQECPTMMFVEEAIVRFNSRQAAAQLPERAALIRTVH